MSRHDQFSCFLVGEGTLPIQCAEILLNRGHKICGVISPDVSINQWAHTKNIPFAGPGDDLIAFLRRPTFDYLFSIVNVTYYYSLLKDGIEAPRKCAINYHDSLLPKYAGFYPTSWALMNKENTHGVTWHEMTELIDAGNILKQGRVPIAPTDTAFTLNAKCYDAAIHSFGKLVEDLASGGALGRKQDLKQRTFFSSYKRPFAACLLRWDRRAQDINAFVRALDFTPYSNPLGLPKLAAGKNFYIVSKIDVLDTMSGLVPGTVITMDEDCLRVSTADQDVVLRILLTADGEPLQISDFVSQLQLREGDHLGSLDENVTRRITACYAIASRHERFWMERLSRLHPLRIPQTGRGPFNAQTGQHATLKISLPNEVITLLKTLDASWKTEEFFLAAFAAYLSRIVRDSHFDIGFSGVNLQRKLAGLEELFASFIPLRVNADCTLTFTEFFNALRTQVDLVGRHGTYTRDIIARYPVLRSALGLKGSMLPIVVVQTDKLEDYKPNHGSEFALVTAQNAAECLWTYSGEKLHEHTIMSMASQFATFLRGIAGDPDRKPIADVPLLGEKDHQHILIEFNNSFTEYPQDFCIQELFEKQAERTPEAIALVFEDQQLTYRELNTRANQLAHYLIELGVGPETRVGIFMERSVEMVVSVLGILKTGGSYTPLHPDYPKERIILMVADIEASILLTQERILPKLPKLNAKSICLDAEWKTIAQRKRRNPISKAIPDNLAYVTYTSGSTGKPNAVMVEHRSLVNYINWVNRSLLHDGPDNVPMVSRLNFDGCLKQLFAPLLRGGQVRVLSDDVVLQPAALLDALSKGPKVGLNCVPSLWASILDAIDSGQAVMPAENFTTLFLGGEKLGEDLVQRSQVVAPQLKVWNLYGPTETTANATAARIHADGEITIGQPIANAQIYILDPSLNPVPIGIPGELYIGGVGLARGYLNRPDLTAEKFIPNPFSDEPGRRLYKTGDLTCYMPNGHISFFGRSDDQVKIRGFRIEPGEIEVVLSNHPSVCDAVVVVRKDSSGNERLVGYVVSHEPIQVADLRKYLKERLPEYMVPTAFVFLNSLPLTHNGKLDRKALPLPDTSRSHLDEMFVAPRTPTEKLLAEIWKEVLRVDKVGVHDNFFELGGHSLLATQVVSRLCHTFAVEVPLRKLFEHPTVAEIAAVISEQQKTNFPEEARIIDRVSASLKPVPRERHICLSFAQQRLWFLDQYEPNSSVYNMPMAWQLKGKPDVQAMERSLNEIVRRHESLRTIFSTVDGEPVQVIAPTLEIILPVKDLSDLPSSNRESEAQRLVAEQHSQPFDLSRGPLLRVLLIRLGQDDHILVLTMHHIVSDGWSRGVLYRELSMLYEAYSQGRASPLSELAIQYADFAIWQRNWLQGEVLEEQLSYWKKQLAGAPARLNLPTDRPRPAVQSYWGASQSFDLSQELTKGLKARSAEHGVSLFMTLFAAFQTLLYRYTRQEDIVVGSPIANRNRKEIEDLIGFFVNTLVLRTNFAGDPTFKELLGRVRETALEAYGHQDLPFEKLVEELNPERNLSHSPLFQVMFVFQNTPGGGVKFPELEVNAVLGGGEAAKFDLTLSVEEAGGGLRGSLHYSTELFDGVTMERMLRHWKILLEGIVTEPPGRRLSELPILTEAEKHQLLVEWNDTQADYPVNKYIHQLFEEQVERTPEAIALVFEDQQLNYRELNNRANQVAHYLQKRDVGPDVLVGICMERSINMVMGLLGILKAGGAYVPLDPSYPKERLGFMIEDTDAGIVLTDMLSLKSLPPTTARAVCLDQDWGDIAKQPQVNPSSQSTAESLASVIYTSGSTGTPKGVEVPHRGIVRLLFGVDYVHLDTTQTFLHLAPISFDAATFEVWGALLHGSKCVLFPGNMPSPRRLGEVVKKHRVTTLWLTAALFNTVINEEPQNLSDVGQLLIGGEALSVPHVRKGLAQLPNTEIINGYGPTENTTFTCCYAIPCQLYDNLSSIPIGRPIGNTQVYILDRHLNPVPVGVAGELHIGGDGLARGYRNRPELTAEKFIGNPFSEDPKSRLYKTGDMARYLPDGNIEFLGRIDNQVKIRGFRIELGEIEAVLGEHGSIKEAVVVAREDSPGDRRLAAYVVPISGASLSAHELRTYLQGKLPEYMMPSKFVFLDSLPLTPNGKVNRKGLPAPATDRPELDSAFAGPRTPTEKLLAGIWTEVLKIERICVYDNFFDLGGHSLLAMQVMSRISNTLHTELPLRTLFEYPTVAGLAAQIAQVQEQSVSQAEMAELLNYLESLSDDDAQRLVGSKRFIKDSESW